MWKAYAPLPHHSTYRSVYSGSQVFTSLLVLAKQGRIARFGQLFFCNDRMRGFPRLFPTVRQLMHLPFFQAQLSQVLASGSHPFSPAPYHCPDSSAHPLACLLHLYKPEIVHPASYIRLEFFFVSSTAHFLWHTVNTEDTVLPLKTAQEKRGSQSAAPPYCM